MLKITRGISLLLPAALLCAACDKGPTNKDQAPVYKTAAAPGLSVPADKVPAPKAAAADGQKFGEGVKLTTSESIDRILAKPEAYKGKTVRVEGMITDVCEGRGCWFEMAGEEPGHKLRFKVTDGEMVFPVDAKGKWAVAEGALAVHELTLEATREYAEEQAHEKGVKFDPASVTKPLVLVRIDGTGAVIRDKK